MTPPRLTTKVHRRFHYLAALAFARRNLRMRNHQPLITFTFDDFPRSALFLGGKILEEFGAVGTYFAAMGLTRQTGPTGEIFHKEDLVHLFEHGHELGCHTYSHCNASVTSAREYEHSILANQQAQQMTLFSKSVPECHSYPIGNPKVSIKRCVSRHFQGCRGGGQTFNAKIADLNHLHGFFLEQANGNLEAIKRLIHENSLACGWLIFATHDVCPNHTRFGCDPSFFEQVVRASICSGAKLVPMSEGLRKIAPNPSTSL